MAQTFTAYYPNIVFAASKNMAAIINQHATELIKIRRIGLLNTQVAAVTGVACQLDVRLYTGSVSLAGSTNIIPTAHDTTNTLPISGFYQHAGTVAGTLVGTFRRVFWSSDEPAISTATSDELECFVPFNIIFDAGYADTNIQPLVLRQDQMLSIFNTQGAAGQLDIWIEFTKE